MTGSDTCLSPAISEPLLNELAPKPLLRDGARTAFHRQRLRLSPRAQARVRLFFQEERPAEVNRKLRAHWQDR